MKYLRTEEYYLLSFTFRMVRLWTSGWTFSFSLAISSWTLFSLAITLAVYPRNKCMLKVKSESTGLMGLTQFKLMSHFYIPWSGEEMEHSLKMGCVQNSVAVVARDWWNVFEFGVIVEIKNILINCYNCFCLSIIISCQSSAGHKKKTSSNLNHTPNW